MKKTLLAALFASVIAGPAFAAPQTYVVDSSHTFPRFSYNHMGLSKQILSFKNTSGTVVFDKDANEAEVDITIDMTAVNTGFDLFDQHIQGEDFFDTAQYPTATFKSTNVVFEGDKPATIEGELTIKDITKPVTLTVTSFYNGPHPMLQNDAIGANATATVLRTDFGVDKHVPHVSDEVTLDIALEAIVQD